MTWRYLRGNRSTAQPTQHIVFDTETVPQSDPEDVGAFSHRWRLGHAIGWRYERGEQSRRLQIHTADPGALWAFVEGWLDPHRSTWVWAHNLGFDLTVSRFWERMEKQEYTIQEPRARYRARAKKPGNHRELPGFACLDDPPTILSLWHLSGARVTFLDTLNFWKCSLAELGAMAGQEKWPLPDWTAPYSTWAAYCQNDAEILERAVLSILRFVAAHDLGKMRYTAPAQAMSAFRHRFYRHRICFHDCKAVRALERASYVNGRVEAFYRGRVRLEGVRDWFGGERKNGEREKAILGQVYHLDVSALYPSVMAHNNYPCKLLLHVGPVKDATDHICRPPENCIARVRLETPIPFPVRIRERGVVYAVGSFTTTLAGPELAQAHQGGFIRTWEETACYECQPLFTDFVLHFWQLRQQYENQGDAPRAELCKLLMNSLYGKFAQRTPEWVDRPEMKALEQWGAYALTWYPDQDTYAEQVAQYAAENPDWQPGTPLVRSYRALAGHVQEMHRRLEADGNFTAIASFVTSYGRSRMNQLHKSAGPRNTYYQGVDSLHVSPEGLARLTRQGAVAERSLGLLRLEGTYSDVKYYGPMDYVCDGRIVRSGWKHNGAAVAPDQWQQRNFQGVTSLIASRPTGTVLETQVKLTHRGNHSGAIVDRDGWTQPVQLPG